MWRKPSADVQQLIEELGQISQVFSPKAGQHRDDRQLARAIETATQAVNIASGWGEESPALSHALDSLGKLFVAAGEYGKAAPLYRQALAIDRKVFGEESQNVAVVLHNMAEMNQAAGDYAAARPLLEEALAIRRQVPRERHRDLLANLDDLAGVHYEMGDYAAARPLLEEALALRRERGEKHADVATNLASLATVDLAAGDYVAAAALFEEALSIARRTQGEESTAVASVLNGLAALHRAVGNHAAAHPMYLKSLTIRRKALGEEHPDVATTLNNLAVLHQAAGDYAAARPLLEEALAIQRKTLGERHPDLVNTLNNLVAIHQATGDFEAAQAHLKEAVGIARQALAKEHPKFAITLTHLAAQHRVVGDYAAAEPLLAEVLTIRRKTLGENHPHVAETLNNLAILHVAKGDYEAAEPLLQEALTIVRATLGGRHAEVATILNTLAMGHANRGDYGHAEPLLQEAVTIYRSALGEAHPLVATSLHNLAIAHGATGRAAEARRLMDQAAEIAERMLGHVFAVGSERQRMAYLATLTTELHRYLSLIVEDLTDTPAAVQAGLDLVMRRKALGAEALAVQRDAVLGRRYPAIERELRELSTLRGQIGRKTLDGPGPEGSDGHRRILAAWSSRRETLEGELARRIPEMRLEQRLREADRRAIADALPADSVLVEFVRFDVFDFRAVPARNERSWKPAHYLAFVLPAGRPDVVRLVDLGEAERIDRLVAAFLESTGRGRSLPSRQRREVGRAKRRGNRRNTGAALPVATRDLGGRGPLSEASSTNDGVALRAALLDPLAVALGGCRRLLLAPDGDLACVPFEVLPTGDNRRMIDDYLISYLSVGRDVLRFMTAVSCQPGDPLVAADPDFDFTGSGMPSLTATVTEQVRHQSRDLDRGSLRFERLRGTRVEGERIASALGVPPLLQQEVVESRVKATRSPRILHLATHGFFLPDQSRDPETRSLPISELGAAADIGMDRLSAGRLENPFLRSGLALAGANAWLQQRPLAPEIEDGLLTAEDVTGLDLLGTELVVLSACQTGLGDVHAGEGVFGLRRAFVLAGAKTLVMSLWKVPDKQTAELMEHFYRSLKAGAPRAAALREAQLAVKAKYQDPFYWGAFVCQGDPNHLRTPMMTNRDAVGHKEQPPAQPSEVMVQAPFGDMQTPSAGRQASLRVKLLQTAFSARGDGLHQSTLHRRALELGVGAPLHATGERISYEGSDYAYQVFARDTLFEDSDRPGEVQCLSDFLVGQMPMSGLALALLAASYRAVGAEFRAADIYHQVATTQQLGYPLSVRVGTRQHDFQVFSTDVLFDCLPKTVRKHPGDIERLSVRADSSGDYLWTDIYRTLKLPFDPVSPFHQLALERWIGVPLGNVLTIQHEGITLRVQVFTLDTVYVASDGVAGRMSDLATNDTSESVEHATESFEARMFWGLGGMHAVSKRYEDALTAFDRAIELDPGVSDFFYSRGSAYADLHMHQEALADFNQAIRLNPNNAATYNDRGTILRILGRHVEALTDFDQAISRTSNYAKAHYNRGLLYGVLGRYQESLKDLNRVIELDENVAQVYFSRGLTYGHLERFDEALRDFDRAIDRDPNHADAYSSRANIYNKLKRHEDALRDCEKAMALSPNNALAYINAAVALRYSGRLSEAIPLLVTAARIGDPNHSTQATQMLTQAKALLRG